MATASAEETGSPVKSRMPGRFVRTSGQSPLRMPAGLSAEIVPVEIAGRRRKPCSSKRTKRLAATPVAEALAKLKPVFDPNGTVTAGNAPSVNDGAGAMVVASEDWANEHDLSANGPHPRSRLRRMGSSLSGVHTPYGRREIALQKAGLTIDGHRSGRDQRSLFECRDHRVPPPWCAEGHR